MGRLTTHVLDTANGCPAQGVAIELSRVGVDGARTRLASITTNSDGRTDAPLLTGRDFAVGTYELVFNAGEYFRRKGTPTAAPPFLTLVPVRFTMADVDGHYHVPLLVSPWSYSTYRGS
jgi:5-hydroxyisourate hydrolase